MRSVRLAWVLVSSAALGQPAIAADTTVAPGTLPLAGVPEAVRHSSPSPRRTLSLDGEWQFQLETEVGWRSAVLPAGWEVSFPDLRGRAGSATYRKTVRVPYEWKFDPWIVFGAVDYSAVLTVNDRYVGSHEGGYTPFVFDLSSYVRPGEVAAVSLTVTDSGPDASARGYPFDEIPHGKQSWYGNVSGPWQSIRLEERTPTHVKTLKVQPRVLESAVSVEVLLSRVAPGASGTLLTTIYAPGGGAPVSQSRIPLTSATRYLFTMPVPAPELWSPDSPRLYTINTSAVTESGSVVDDHADRFGMRSIDVRDGKILLNGEPVFLAGVLDQDFYPHTHYTVPSEEFLRDQFQKAKRLGINLLRCHIKIPDPMYLSLADEMGLLVWYELPSAGKLTPKSRARLTDTLREAIARDFNHPSLIIVSLFNESWGIDLKSAEQRKWLAAFYDFAKTIAPGRLIVDNSPCRGNFHIKSDIDDFHCYRSIPDHAGEWADWVREFSDRPAWSYSEHGDAVRTGAEPLVVSEFGNWGLPSVPLLRECYDGSLPWWFESRSGHLRPDGVEERFSALDLGLVFGDFRRFARATQESQLLAFKWQIEEMRKYPQIAGYCWTELTDLQWEANGLLDYCRNIKASGRSAAQVQKPRCVFTRTDTHAVKSGGVVRGQVWGSNFGEAIDAGSVVEWHLEGFPAVKGFVTVMRSVGRADAVQAGGFEFEVPAVNASRAARLVVRWMTQGKEVASNYEDLYFYPAVQQSFAGLSFYLDASLVSREGVELWLERRGARVTGILETSDVAITGRWSPAIRQWTAEGGRTLLLAEDESCAGAVGDAYRIASRREKRRWGDHQSSFIWLSERSMFAGVPSRSGMLDWQFERIIPVCVIEGVGDSMNWMDVHSGIFVSWLGNPAAIAMRAGNERSRLIISTFPVGKTAATDPVADKLLENMIRDLTAEGFVVHADLSPI